MSKPIFRKLKIKGVKEDNEIPYLCVVDIETGNIIDDVIGVKIVHPAGGVIMADICLRCEIDISVS